MNVLQLQLNDIVFFDVIYKCDFDKEFFDV